ncbi:hypothetical protein [uncultured Megasphaera sp.]|uniref:hypothetical protein n=1 Tax=uncultured Megasphaera sp. TaxID=165188 RepID=UPI002591563C|nr:hypothetical protein [uncultured Megasphaera sp.]
MEHEAMPLERKKKTLKKEKKKLKREKKLVKLLSLLQDEAVQLLICEIVTQRQTGDINCRNSSKTLGDFQPSNDSVSCSENKRKEHEDSSMETNNLQERDAQDRADNLKKENEKFQKEMKAAQDRADNLEKENKKFQKEMEAMQGKTVNLEKQLQMRFAEGWQLFEEYQHVSAHTKQLLTHVFARSDFPSFICGGAKTESLEKIWEVMKEYELKEDKTDRTILEQLFKYFMKLVNQTYKTENFALIEPTVGDNFDYEIQSGDKTSKTQGSISCIRLFGYKNLYANKIVKKPLVHVE